MSDEFPESNPGIDWYRMILWTLPSCVLVTSSLAAFWLRSHLGGQPTLWALGWLAFNGVTTVATGFAYSYLTKQNEPGEDLLIPAGRFLVLQLIYAPALLLFFGICYALTTR